MFLISCCLQKTYLQICPIAIVFAMLSIGVCSNPKTSRKVFFPI